MTLGTSSCFKRYFFKLQKEPKAQAEELAKKKSKLAKMKIWANLKIGFSIGLQVSTYLYKNSYFEFSKKWFLLLSFLFLYFQAILSLGIVWATFVFLKWAVGFEENMAPNVPPGGPLTTKVSNPYRNKEKRFYVYN